MAEFYLVHTTKTAKPMGPNTGPYTVFDDDETEFVTLDEVKEYLEETYGDCKRVRMYRDKTNGEPEKTGWVYCFKNADCSHTPVQHWWQQDWVTVYKIQSRLVLT